MLVPDRGMVEEVLADVVLVGKVPVTATVVTLVVVPITVVRAVAELVRR